MISKDSLGHIKYLIFHWIILIAVGLIFGACNIFSGLKKENIVINKKLFIPKEVIIPSGYKISNIYNNGVIDFNKDGLNDFVFDLQKENINIGDTSYVVFYKMNKDSSFSFCKKFDNLFPIYFPLYFERPNIKNKELETLFYDCYMGMNKPFSYFEIQNDSVFFTKRLSGNLMESIRYLYKFDLQKNDWILTSKSRSTKNGYYPFEIRGIKLLSDFSYCED